MAAADTIVQQLSAVKIEDDVLQTPKDRTGLVYDERMVEHLCMWDSKYPENPGRFSRPLNRCREYRLVERCLRIPSRPATENEIAVLHRKEYIDVVKGTSHLTEADKLEEVSSNYDAIYFHPKTYDLALLSAGCTIDLVSAVLKRKVQNGMAIIRPPGHHAMENQACGYCFFNNVALAARYAIDHHGLNRILIVDWDVHHGQATQFMFYDDPRVLYFSIHRYEHGEFWPNLRESDSDYIGRGKGEGYNINVPLNKTGMGNADYLAIFHQLLLPVAYEYCPELVIVSAGYDAALGCPEGEMEVTPAAYCHLLSSLMGLASGKVCVILEGGYCLTSLAESVALSLRTLLGDPCPSLGPLPPPCTSVQETILDVLAIQRPYWNSLCFQGNFEVDKTAGETRTRHQPRPRDKGPWRFSKPEKFATRDCYPVQSSELRASLEERLRQLISETKLTVPLDRTCFVYDEEMTRHYDPAVPFHPERPERIKEIYAKLERQGLPERCLRLKSRRATQDELLLFHRQSHIAAMKNLETMDVEEFKMCRDPAQDTSLCAETYGAALLASGCLLQVVDNVMSKTTRNGVAVIRPPGHHAEENHFAGFCIFNNVAIAAKYALKKYNLSRILIVDWDIHHGNGIQHAFYDDPRVLYMSIHRYDGGAVYPFLPDADYTYCGSGAGRGFNVNVAWNGGGGMSDGDYLAAFFHLILPAAYQFDPELVLVASGFDAARGDVLGQCNVSPEAYAHMTHLLTSLANGRVVIALEGGYNLKSISAAMAYCTATLLGDPCPPLTPHLRPCNRAKTSILNTVRAQQPFWSCLKFDVDLPAYEVKAKALDDSFVNQIPSIDVALAATGKEELGTFRTVNSPCQHFPERPWQKMEDDADCSKECACKDSCDRGFCLTCKRPNCSNNYCRYLHAFSSGHSLFYLVDRKCVLCYICQVYFEHEGF